VAAGEPSTIASAAVSFRALTVAHVIHSLGAGGAEAVLVDLARTAPSVGLNLTVVGLSDAQSDAGVDRRIVPQLKELGVTVHEMHSGRYDLTAAFRLARMLRNQRIDVVHTHLKHADVVGGLAARLARLPSVSTLHVIDTPTSRTHQLRVKAGVLARQLLSSAVIALSTAQQRWYREYAGPHSAPTILPNGVIEPQVTRDQASIRAELGVPEDALLAVFVSLMRPEKGHADLLEAIRQLPSPLRLVVAMAGDGPLLECIRTTVASDRDLRERVRILGFRRDVVNLLAASDFVVHPSLEDALPTALISALAAARPIVATNVGGIPDIVGPDCGLLVEPGLPSALSDAIAAMADIVRCDSNTLEGMRRAARLRYESRFSADVWVKSLWAVYQAAIDARLGATAVARHRENLGQGCGYL
jgi:glycosyltransferase involved in cell wall biosynthesis